MKRMARGVPSCCCGAPVESIATVPCSFAVAAVAPLLPVVAPVAEVAATAVVATGWGVTVAVLELLFEHAAVSSSNGASSAIR